MTERAFVVGDLHLGAGAGDPLEDFQDDDVFARFCERISDSDTTLVLNGDIVDFAQIPPFDVPKPAHLLWPEAASVTKVETALAAHRDFFAALARLIRAGGRVRMLIGNHDLDMIWPQVQTLIARALGQPSTSQLEFTVGATRFHGVHIEHGHHFTPENCPREPEKFVHSGPNGVAYLERVWGTDFMLQFYNDLERSHPYADNVKPMVTVMWHGLRQGWIRGRDLLRLMLFLKRRGVPWRGIASSVLSEREPLSAATVAAAFDDPNWYRVVLERAQDPDFVAALELAASELEPEEQRLSSEATRVEIPAPVVNEDEAATLGVFRDDRELRAARERLASPGVTHVVFGHTHAAVDGALKGRLFNYGTWLKHLDLKSEQVAAKIKAEGITLDMLKDDRLYSVNRLAVRIDADNNYESKVRLVDEATL
jgi:UDP-2,3-diacylglucosamine pyrophosphatase LpxH